MPRRRQARSSFPTTTRRAPVVAALVALTVAAGLPASSWAKARELTLAEKVGQLVMFSIEGTSLSGAERDKIARHHLGGVILFRHNYADRSQLAALTRQIQTAVRRGNTASIGALISVDQEGGVVKRFPDLPPWKSAPEIGESERTSVAYQEGRRTGRALRAAGVNVNLAPVADLDLPPEHVMAARSFGSRRHRVGKMVRAFVGGLQSRGVAATAKHFPGLGGATINTDYGRSYVRRTKWQLHHVDVKPFHYAVRRGIRLVMLSHALYVNDGGHKPASMSRYIATQRLRRELGFTGVAISDALEAVAWRFGGSTPKACAATIRAGVDVALVTAGVAGARACAAAIRRAVRSGEISRSRIDQAVERVLDLKAWIDG